MGVMRPELVMKSIVPVVMAGVLGIYGLIIAVIISTGSKASCLSLHYVCFLKFVLHLTWMAFLVMSTSDGMIVCV